jgi:hypothetical protein
LGRADHDAAGGVGDQTRDLTNGLAIGGGRNDQRTHQKKEKRVESRTHERHTPLFIELA